MIDTEIKKFYSNVKDPTWPEISTYFEFTQLPDAIKEECYAQHNFASIVQNTCNPNHWTELTTMVFMYENVGFVPVTKCGSTYYTDMLSRSGWKATYLKDVDQTSTQFFGGLIHPLTRHAKGVTELLEKGYSEFPKGIVNSTRFSNPWDIHEFGQIDFSKLKHDLSGPSLSYIVSNISAGDRHAMPYFSLYGDFMHKVTWFPFDVMSCKQQTNAITKFCTDNGITDLNFDYCNSKKHESDNNKLEIYKTVVDIISNNTNTMYSLYSMYGQDLRLYYQLLDDLKNAGSVA